MRGYWIGANSPPPGYPPGSYEIAPGMWVAPGHTTHQEQQAALARITDPNYAAQTSAAGARNVGAYSSAPPPEPHVPANAPVLHPCVTRAALMAQNPGMESTSMLTFDHLGCMLDPVSGFRILEGCKDHDPRVLCPVSSAPRDLDAGTSDRIAAFVQSVVPIVSSLGPGLAELLGPGLRDLTSAIGSAGTVQIGRELQGMLDIARAYVLAIFGAIHSGDVGPVIETFQRLGGSAKTLTDILQTTLGDAGNRAMLVAHSGAREALSVASNMLRGDEASIRTVEALAHDAPLSTFSHAGAKLAQDAAKSLGVIQSAVSGVHALRGVSDAATLEAFAGAMPDLAMVPADHLANLTLPGDAGALASDLATKWTGKGEALLASLDPAKLAALVPDPRRAFALANKIALGRAFSQTIAPAVARADQILGSAHDKAQSAIDGRALPELAGMADADREAWARGQLASGQAQADAIVASAAESARALLGPLPHGARVVSAAYEHAR